jgi:hypothetical protein
VHAVFNLRRKSSTFPPRARPSAGRLPGKFLAAQRGVGPFGRSAGPWLAGGPRLDGIKPRIDRWLVWIRRQQTLDLVYLGALALVLALAAYMIVTG